MSVFAFLFYLAVGIVLTLPFVRLGPEGRSFYLFAKALSLVLAVLESIERQVPIELPLS